MRLFTFVFSLLAAPFLLLAPVLAEGLAPPDGPVILTVSGTITQANSDDRAVFDLAMLDALEGRATHTRTPWHEGEQAFSGPLLSAVLAAAGAEGTMLRIIAVNDYSADMPVADAIDFPVILATRRNGTVMTVRDKGPLFVIYPFDENPDLYNEVYFGRSVWQAVSIEVRAE